MSVVQGDAVTMADLLALNYTILIPYNASIPTGGDSLADNLNLYYTVGLFPYRENDPCCPLSAFELTVDGFERTVWRPGMDHDLFRIGPSYDSRCWVRDSHRSSHFDLSLLTKPPGSFLASFIPDSPEESRPCRLSGFLSCQPLSSVSSGSSGASPWPFHMTPASSLATSTTSASGMFSLGLRSEAAKSPTCYSPSTNACSPPLRE